MKRKTFLKSAAGLGFGIATLSSFQTVPSTIEKTTLIPKALKPGDLIGITAPAGCIWNKSHVEKVETILQDMGFKTQVGKTVYLQEGYLAGDDKTRAAELMAMFADQSVKAILTMRGGWGCARILDLLDYEEIKNNPKIVMGFSDITSLINAIYQKTGLITYHGPCGYSSWGDFTVEQMTYALIGGKPYTMKNPTSNKTDLKTWVNGTAQGRLIGGNLTVMVSMIGTEYEPHWGGKLLFLEEIGEEPYRVDRMLWQMKQAGVFKQINGLIIGSFRKCEPEEPHKSFTLEEVFQQHFEHAGFPVYQGASFGHIAPKFTLAIGTHAQMDADNFTIQLLERPTLP